MTTTNPGRRPFDGFDETTYLDLNPDVARAVKDRSVTSGLEHFFLHGMYEERRGVAPGTSEQARALVEHDLPVPPVHLRKRVHGDEDLDAFRAIGRIVSFNLYCAISPVMTLGRDCRILDFGSGCGRIISYFHRFTDNSRFCGSDIDGEAIAWCQRNLGEIAQFHKNGNHPPLPFADESFDFVYSISIFTHLPEDMQFEWLRELRRVTRKGGYLILTTHGEELLGEGSTTLRKQLGERGFYYSVGAGTDGLPDYYQTSFHTHDYIREHWSRYFRIEKVIPRGIANHQDLVLCRRTG